MVNEVKTPTFQFPDEESSQRKGISEPEPVKPEEIDTEKLELYEPKETEDFVALDRMDEEQIIRELSGELVTEYVYSFKQGGRTIIGLSYAGVKACIHKMGNIEVDGLVIQDGEESYRAYCYALDKLRNIKVWGAFEQPKNLPNGKLDPFAYTKAVSKAQRNAMRALLPEPIIKALVREYLERQKKGGPGKRG